MAGALQMVAQWRLAFSRRLLSTYYTKSIYILLILPSVSSYCKVKRPSKSVVHVAKEKKRNCYCIGEIVR